MKRMLLLIMKVQLSKQYKKPQKVDQKMIIQKMTIKDDLDKLNH